jgi:hypothetical protein
MRSCLLILLLTMATTLYGRSFSAEMKPAEKERITYITNTLADTWTPALLLKKKELEKAGDAVAHIHPLRYLGLIFANQELRQALRKVRKKSWVWGQFWDPMKMSLNRETERGEMDSTISFRFSELTKTPSVRTLIDERKWDEMIEHLFSANIHR